MMNARTIRMAKADEHEAITQCVRAAYSPYIERIGKEPAPMFADYPSLIERRVVYVLTDETEILGVLVMMPQEQAMFVENIAIYPHYQGQGLGRTLMAFVEQHARERNLQEISLYTNELMTENLRFYQQLGFVETDRYLQDGYRRVFLRKKLA
jgi:ribosomal protein S18 acetylase RimI-like enzyme